MDRRLVPVGRIMKGLAIVQVSGTPDLYIVRAPGNRVPEKPTAVLWGRDTVAVRGAVRFLRGLQVDWMAGAPIDDVSRTTIRDYLNYHNRLVFVP